MTTNCRSWSDGLQVKPGASVRVAVKRMAAVACPLLDMPAEDLTDMDREKPMAPLDTLPLFVGDLCARIRRSHR